MRFIPAFMTALFLCSGASAQSNEEAELVLAMFRAMNPQSITYDREVCGYIVRNPAGRLEVSKASWGGVASCGTMPVPAGYQIVSSWHTHAAWAQGYDNEVPSTVDVEGDLAQHIDGWLATPGGRVWFINGQTGEMHQYCGPECMPSDPNSRLDSRGPVDRRYSLAELRARFASR